MLVRHLARFAGSKPALALVCIAFVLAVTTTVALLIRSSPAQAPPQPRPGPASGPTTTGPATTGGNVVAQTDDPYTFAVSAASTLFAWDTTSSTPLSEYSGRLLAAAAPSGEESAGLVTDLSTYLPSPESWEDLKTYETRQWIDVQSYEMPDEWKSAEVNGEATDLAEGTSAITVTGLRRRSGIWQGKPAQTVDEVSFTIFMTCRPTYDTCRLLRLSQLNKPLR